MAKPITDIEIWAEDDYVLPQAATENKIRPIDDLWKKGYDVGQTPDAQAWNYVWNMLSTWVKYLDQEKLPSLDNSYLQRSLNLLDLEDVTEARLNLKVYSTTETESRYFKYTGGSITGGLKVTGTAQVDNTAGVNIKWNEVAGSGSATITNNRGTNATGGFIFKSVSVSGSTTTELGRLTILEDGSLATTATIRSGSVEVSGNSTVVGSSSMGSLSVTTDVAKVSGKNVVRSVNNVAATDAGNVTITIPSPGVTDVRLGAQSTMGASDDFKVPTGCFITGLAGNKVTGPNFELHTVYYRPVQKYLNGSWITASQA